MGGTYEAGSVKKDCLVGEVQSQPRAGRSVYMMMGRRGGCAKESGLGAVGQHTPVLVVASAVGGGCWEGSHGCTVLGSYSPWRNALSVDFRGHDEIQGGECVVQIPLDYLQHCQAARWRLPRLEGPAGSRRHGQLIEGWTYHHAQKLARVSSGSNLRRPEGIFSSFEWKLPLLGELCISAGDF